MHIRFRFERPQLKMGQVGFGSVTLLLVLISLTVCAKIQMPKRYKTEGRITLIYPSDKETLQYHLVFSEAIDDSARKSTVSIGYVAYKRSKYFSRPGCSTITLDNDGICKSVVNRAPFVHELAWFVDLMLPNVNLLEFLESQTHQVGPTGLIHLMSKLVGTGDSGVRDAKLDYHRSILCFRYKFQGKIPNQGINIDFEYLVPDSGVNFRNAPSAPFSVKASAYRGEKGGSAQNYTFVIDYYNIDSTDGESNQIDRMKDDFNLPVRYGCSEFLIKSPLSYPSQSFSLALNQASSSEQLEIAYDHSAGYMRREITGKSVSIWDLNESLLYHTDSNTTDELQKYINVKPCSVLKIDDERLGPSFRPFVRHPEQQTRAYRTLDVLKMFGATNLAFMGRGSTRDLPCLVYETVLDEPPVIFASMEEEMFARSEIKRDYIVIYYLIEGSSNAALDSGEPINVNFWPATIELYRRRKDINAINYIDRLDIYDFSSTLFGWELKGPELFMASECFDNEDEQLRVQLAYTLPHFHSGAISESEKSLLPKRKFQLESALIDDFFSLIKVSRMHLKEYDLTLRSDHVNLNMLISDRTSSKKLAYVGEGQLLKPNSYASGKVTVTGRSEHACVTLASIITLVSLVIYCPTNERQDSLCTSVYGEKDPSIVLNKNPDKNNKACQVYRFESAEAPARATVNIHEKRYALEGHKLRFPIDGERDGLKMGQVDVFLSQYEINQKLQLITIDNYMYAIADNADTNDDKDQQSDQISDYVRSFRSISYQSEGDCARMCGLDVDCKSYSYCYLEDSTSPTKCILSSLDIRGSNIENQLVDSAVKLDVDKQISVKNHKGTQFNLTYKSRCKIFERNYLDMFRHTEEVIRFDRSLVQNFKPVYTTFECAKQSADLELSSPDYHVDMFAYCPTSNTCLMDKNLFAPSKNQSATDPSSSGVDEEVEETDGMQSDSREVLCRIYRKKYQTYFHVSTKVIKQQQAGQTSASKQMQLKLDTVEECAHACWNKFGQVCASFDYCSPGFCFVNEISARSKDAELETRPRCIHYERDLRLDELRKKHRIGRHNPLEKLDSSSLIQTGSNSNFGGIIMRIFTYSLVFCAFLYGLKLGRNVSDKLDSVTILSQSIPTGSSVLSANRMFDYKAYPADGNDESASPSAGAATSNEGYDGDLNDAIMLEVLNGEGDQQERQSSSLRGD